MNVLLIFPHFHTPQDGSSLRSWQIGRFLIAKGHDVTVFVPGIDLVSGCLYPFLQGRVFSKRTLDGVKLIYVRTLQHFRRSVSTRIIYEVTFAVLTFLRAIFDRQFDAVVIGYPPAVSPIFGYLLARLWRVPVIFEVRDLMADALMANDYVKKQWFNRLAISVEKFLCARCDHLICVTPGIRRVLESRGVPKASITVVTNGFEPEVFEGPDKGDNPRNAYGWGDRLVVIYTGALTQSYDIPTLLRAARRLKDNPEVLFVLIGNGERKVTYQTYCDREGLKNVQFITAQPRNRIRFFLRSADLGVHLFPDHPLWEIVLGNKTFDYLGSGLPMLYAGRGDTADLIRAANAGKVVEPEDDAAVADAILWFQNHPTEAAHMGQRGRSYVMQHYNRHRLLEPFEEVLQLAVDRRSHRAGS